MLLIGDSNDPSGNGMFSRSGRKLNKFFINLNRPSPLVPKLYFNEMKPPKPASVAFKIRKQTALQPKPSEAKKQPEPLSLIRGRDYYQGLEERMREAPTYGNYNPKPVYPKVKILRNYNYEECKERPGLAATDLSLSGRSKGVFSPEHKMRRTCPRFQSYETKLSQGPLSMPRFVKVPGFVDFDKQTKFYTGNQQLSTEYDLNAEVSFQRTQISFAPGNIDFCKTLSRIMHLERKKFQRNNYALNVKHDLVEKKLSLVVPDFNNALGRRPLSCKPVCLNKDFYEAEKVKLSTKTPFFGKTKGRSDVLFK
jgi:hypothetical protein